MDKAKKDIIWNSKLFNIGISANFKLPYFMKCNFYLKHLVNKNKEDNKK